MTRSTSSRRCRAATFARLAASSAPAIASLGPGADAGARATSLAAPLLVDLDHVVARLLLVWDESLVTDWLTTANSFLEGARPIDVLARRGSTEVVEAIEAEAAGAYA